MSIAAWPVIVARMPLRLSASPGPAPLALVAILLGAAAAPGCDDPNEVFTGRWESRLPPHEGLVEGAPVLALGHFGREVAGVAYFKKLEPGGAAYDEDCPCAFVEHQGIDLDTPRVSFSTECLASGVVLDWDLELVEDGEDRLLEGTVTSALGGDVAVAVSLEKTEDFVLAEDKECPPPER